MTGQKVATEVAEQEFARFLEAMDLKFDTASMDAEDREGFEKNKRTILDAMEDGRLTIDEKGQPVLQLRDGGSPITFHEPTGKMLMEMDQKKKDHLVARSLILIAALTDQLESRIQKLANRDLKVCNAITTLFLA